MEYAVHVSYIRTHNVRSGWIPISKERQTGAMDGRNSIQLSPTTSRENTHVVLLMDPLLLPVTSGPSYGVPTS
jgi:hypothetical protein